MNLRRLLIIIGTIVLAAIVFIWGCQNHPTAPSKMDVGSGKTRDDYSSGSCTAGSFKVTFSSANFVTGLGWSTGSTRTISYSGSCSGCNWGPGVYGWLQNPLVEYYIPRSGGSTKGSYTCSGTTWTVGTEQRVNQPSIEGTATFTQYFASGGSQPIDMNCHYNGWKSLGLSVGSNNYQVVAVESWSSGSGSATVSVPNSEWYTHWVGSGTATFTCGGGGSTTTSTSTTTTTSATTTSTSTTTTTSGSTTTTSGWWWWWPSTTTTTSGTTTTTTTSGTTTTTSGGGTAPCSNPTSISAPFTKDGSGTFCWSLTSCNYINSWNLQELNVNGVDLTNKYVSASQMPAKINGAWIIKYVGNYSWSHFEAK
ncbi:MAG: glycoside hydrolase family 11 protein [candidate division WOR-3 bacterium]